MDTLGNLLDKQLTAAMKLNNTCQGDKKKNLSIQLDRLSSEINGMAENVLKGNMDPEDAIRPQHKTY